MKNNITYYILSLYPTLILILSWVTVIHCSAFGTPRNLRDIFIGRCEEYQEVIYPKPFITNPKNCSYLYELFYEAFSFRDPCDVPVSNYYNFTTAAEHDIDTKNKVMYWSGSVFPLVYEYVANMRRYVTIRDVLSGYVIRNIEAWCGQKSDPGFNSTDCPPWGQCINQATPTYWQAISENFARRVQGHIDVLLNGSSGSAYRNTSTFSKYELANLDSKRNPSISVLLIHNLDPDGSFRETCKNGSLLKLKNDVENKQISYTCIDDPIAINPILLRKATNHSVRLLCTDHVNSTACGHITYGGATSNAPCFKYNHLLYTVALCFFAFLKALA